MYYELLNNYFSGVHEYENGFCIISSLEIVIYSKCVPFILRKKNNKYLLQDQKYNSIT